VHSAERGHLRDCPRSARRPSAKISESIVSLSLWFLSRRLFPFLCVSSRVHCIQAQRVRLFGGSSIQLFLVHRVWDVVKLHPEINQAQNEKTRLDGF
jgi:hypothetical protein